MRAFSTAWYNGGAEASTGQVSFVLSDPNPSRLLLAMCPGKEFLGMLLEGGLANA